MDEAAAASIDFFQESSKVLLESSELLTRCNALEEEDRELDRKIAENRKEMESLREDCKAKDQHIQLLEKSIASLAHQRHLHEEINSGLRNQIYEIEKKIVEDREKYKTTLAKYSAKWESYLEVYNQFPHVQAKNALEKEVKYLRIILAKKKQEVMDNQKKIIQRNEIHAQLYRILDEKKKTLLAEHAEWEVERVRKISSIEMKRMQLKALDEEYENMMAKTSESDAEGAVRQSMWSNASHLSQISTSGKNYCNKSRSNSDNLLRQPSYPVCGLQSGRSSQFLIPKLNIPSFPDMEIENNPIMKTVQNLSSQHTSLTQPALSSTTRTLLPPGAPFSQGRTSADDDRRDDPQTFHTTISASVENVEQEEQISVMSRNLSLSGTHDGNPSHSILALEVAPNVTASGISQTISSQALSKTPKEHSKKEDNLSKKNETVCEKTQYEKKTVMTPTPSFLSLRWGRQNNAIHNVQAVPTTESSSRLSQDMFISQGQDAQKDTGNTECVIQLNNPAGDTPQIIQQGVQEIPSSQENRAENHKSRHCVEDMNVNSQQANPNFLNAEHDPEMYPYNCQTPPNFDLISSPSPSDETTGNLPPSPQILKNAADERGSQQSGFNPFGFGYQTSVANIFHGPSEDASITSDTPQTGEAFYMFQKNSASTFKLF